MRSAKLSYFNLLITNNLNNTSIKTSMPSPMPAIIVKTSAISIKNSDQDSLGDVCDNCRFRHQPNQEDLDGDKIGDACDNDIDGGSVNNNQDNCVQVINPTQSNIDNDLLGDACDADIDNDGIDNPLDNCPKVKNLQSTK